METQAIKRWNKPSTRVKMILWYYDNYLQGAASLFLLDFSLCWIFPMNQDVCSKWGDKHTFQISLGITRLSNLVVPFWDSIKNIISYELIFQSTDLAEIWHVTAQSFVGPRWKDEKYYQM